MSNRYSTAEDTSSKGNNVAKEFKALFRNGHTDHAVLQSLRSKYKDEDLVNKVFDAYKERYNYILNRATKFKQLLLDRYSAMNLTYDEIIRKAKKYAKKHELGDDEFDLYFKLVMTERENRFNLPNTAMSKTLGYGIASNVSDKLNIKTTEMDTLKEILALYEQTRSLHSQVVLQSLGYSDVGPEALTGKFCPEKHNAYSYIHPALAFLFFPRICFLDEHMLIANIGNIVKSKHEGKALMTRPDWELYWDLIVDPNHHACSSDSPIKDLRNRFILQTRLWDAVLNLRQGKYYHDNLQQFLLAVDNCQSNVYDAPDLTYLKDESTIIRRLLSAFSIRPTIVATSRIFGLVGTNPYGVQTGPLTAAGIQSLTTVPMITLRLPINVTGSTYAVDLEEAMTQPQWFVENKMIVPKQQSIMFSREILLFQIGRRFQSINIARMQSPFNFTSLPMTVSGYETLNKTVVNFKPTMHILGDDYILRSVLLVDDAPSQGGLIVGTSAVVSPREYGGYGAPRFLYDPVGAGVKHLSGGEYKYVNAPVVEIPNEPSLGDDGVEDFMSRANTRGTVFMYEKIRSEKNPYFHTGY